MATHDPGHVQRWRTIFATWRRSGLSVTAFCRSQAINKSGFHRWRNILDQIDRSAATPSAHDTPSSSATFVPLRVIPDVIVEVILPSGLQLRVPLSADAQQLARLVLALGAPPC